MRLYPSSELLEGHQMGNLVNKRDQEAVFINGGIHGDLVATIGKNPVIPVTGDPLVNHLQMYSMSPDQFQAGAHSPLRHIFSQNVVHLLKNSPILPSFSSKN
jgi:hypothetical protein